MSSFVVSARKYRPATFIDVVGQEHVTATLKNALRNDHLAHAFLFTGPRGVGKTTCARILAKVLNCLNPTDQYEPCNQCASCTAFNENASFNINELDAASNNSVEHIRALIEQVRFQPQQGKYKVFIIDEVHMLSQQAFNAFLKTLEEPPSYAIFILATTEKHKIIPTILSRCQIFDFRRIQPGAMVRHLQGIAAKEGIATEEAALHIIAQKADGALRDALSIFDRIVAYAGNQLRYADVIANLNVLDYDYFFRFTTALLTEDLGSALLLFDEVMQKGFDADLFINGLAEHFRQLLVCKDPQTLILLESSETLRERYQQQAQLAPSSFLLTALNLANDCDLNFRYARNKRLHVEMTLMKMAYVQRAVNATPLQAEALPISEEKKKLEPQHALDPPSSLLEPAAEIVSPAEAPAAPTNPVKAETRPPQPVLQLPRLGQLETLVAEVKAAEAQAVAIPTLPLTQDNLLSAWQNYLPGVASETTRSLLAPLQPQLEDGTLFFKVGSGLVESALRQERDLMPHLREVFGRPELTWRIEIEKSESEGAPAKPRPLSNKEKLLLLYDRNPLVKDLTSRLGLRFDGE